MFKILYKPLFCFSEHSFRLNTVALIQSNTNGAKIVHVKKHPLLYNNINCEFG